MDGQDNDNVLTVLADVTTRYYWQLMKASIPDELARTLVRDWHMELVESDNLKDELLMLNGSYTEP